MDVGCSPYTLSGDDIPLLSKFLKNDTGTNTQSNTEKSNGKYILKQVQGLRGPNESNICCIQHIYICVYPL